MKTKNRLIAMAILSAATLGTPVLVAAQEPVKTPQNQNNAATNQWPCPAGMGQGWGMGQGMGPGTIQHLANDLKTSDVERMMNSWLAWQRNPNLKLGKVRVKDKYVIIAEIITKDGSLVQGYEINRQTGWMRPAQ